MHGFTQRGGGVSPAPTASLNTKISPIIPDDIANLAKNIQRIFLKTGLDKKNGVLLYLENDTKVIRIEKCSGWQTLYNFDGAVTNEPGCALAIPVADCFPILLADDKAGVIGIAHAGWRGTVGKITTKVVEQVQKLGARAGDIKAVIGPGICGQCYEVGPEVAERFSADEVKKKPDGKYLLDLAKANQKELRQLGVEKIEQIGDCTFENTDRFFSARREGRTGRFLAFISLV